MTTFRYASTNLLTGEVLCDDIPLTVESFSQQLKGGGSLTGQLNLNGNYRLNTPWLDALECRKSVLWVLASQRFVCPNPTVGTVRTVTLRDLLRNTILGCGKIKRLGGSCGGPLVGCRSIVAGQRPASGQRCDSPSVRSSRHHHRHRPISAACCARDSHCSVCTCGDCRASLSP
jgi:hypothetical protein